MGNLSLNVNILTSFTLNFNFIIGSSLNFPKAPLNFHLNDFYYLIARQLWINTFIITICILATCTNKCIANNS